LATLQGHTDFIYGTPLALADGRLLSCSGDGTLRLWDSQDGKCLAVCRGHTKSVHGALPLNDGRVLSWSSDETLRLWDSQSGKCLAVLEGHTSMVSGSLALADGRLLSWSADKTLRLWEGQGGKCLAVLEGHIESVKGGMALVDGKIISWSNDNTLRLWDGQSGKCLAVLKGHSKSIKCALALADGKILSWSDDNTLRLWDAQSGKCLEIIPENHILQLHPEWLHAIEKSFNSKCVCGDCFTNSLGRSVGVCNKQIPKTIAVWNIDSDTDARCLSADGTTVATQSNGQVCILKLNHGNRRVSLAEVEEILAPQKRK
jgi:WD40 repeat protein